MVLDGRHVADFHGTLIGDPAWYVAQHLYSHCTRRPIRDLEMLTTPGVTGLMS